jgi:hypothetical protein
MMEEFAGFYKSLQKIVRWDRFKQFEKISKGKCGCTG